MSLGFLSIILVMTLEQLQRLNFLELSRHSAHELPVGDSFTLKNQCTVTIIAPGIICFEPLVANPKHIVLSCGIHGNETAPIEICDELVTQILTGELSIQHRLLVVFGNLTSMDIGKRFVEENMNRLFCGAHSEGKGLCNAERVRAKVLEDAVNYFYSSSSFADTRLHYDLHTAIRASKNEKFAVYPMLESGRGYSRSQLAFLASCGVKTILLSQSATTTFSYYSSSRHHAHGFTIELGKVMPFGQNDMQRFADVKASLYQLVTQKDFAPDVAMADLEVFKVNQVINKLYADFTLNFADDLPNFSEFKAGDILAQESGKTYRAQQDGEAIVFPNANVAIGQRALLTVVATPLENLDV
jgi:succinylglutamate desuccinylase